MSQPTTDNFQTREDLGLRYEEFDLAMNQMGFVGHRVMPLLPRTKPSGKFPRVSIEQLNVLLDTKRNIDGTYKRSTRDWNDDDYNTEEHGLEATIDDRTLARYDDIIDCETFEGQVIENSLLMSYEKEVADLMFNATTFTGRTGAVSNEWDDLSNATPVTDINTRITSIRRACGVKPNALVVNDNVFRNLKRCDEVINNLKYQGFQDARPGEISRQALAISLNVDEVIVADSLYNANETGLADSLTDFWSDEYALLARVAVTQNPLERCVGRTFMWSEEGATDGERMGVIAETYYEENRRGGTLRRRTDWGLETMQLECGYLFSNVTT